jgi:hypothetical protein
MTLGRSKRRAPVEEHAFRGLAATEVRHIDHGAARADGYGRIARRMPLSFSLAVLQSVLDLSPGARAQPPERDSHGRDCSAVHGDRRMRQLVSQVSSTTRARTATPKG